MATSKKHGQVLAGKRIAVIGAGKMGSILLQALLREDLFSHGRTCATVQHPERAQNLSRELHIPVGTDNAEAVRNSDIVLICVKPQTVAQVLREVSADIRSEHLFISVAASVSTQYMESVLDREIRVVRAMPNTPASLGYGMTAISAGKFATKEDMDLAETLFNAVGKTVVLDEKHMDAVTGLSASGPAFLYIILESLAEAGVKVGLPRETATLLAAQTMLGAAKVALETGHHPALLKDTVTTPAGCTIDGIMELEEGKLRVTLIKAVVKATQRARELVYGADVALPAS